MVRAGCAEPLWAPDRSVGLPWWSACHDDLLSTLDLEHVENRLAQDLPESALIGPTEQGVE